MFIDDGMLDDFNNETDMRRGDDNLFHAAQDYQMLAETLRDALLMTKNIFAALIKSVKIGGDMIHFGWEVIFNRGKGIRLDDIFITFNYTETLEKVYGISENQVFHIHGCRETIDELVVGHGEDRLRGFNKKYILAADVLEEGIRNLRKDTDAVVKKHACLWDAILKSSITDIYCFGFSFSNVDLPYISKISSLIGNNETCSWHLNTFSHEDNEYFERVIRECGFTGCVREYDASKMLIPLKRNTNQTFDFFNKEENVRFYYDESNFFGKLYLKESKAGDIDFNIDINKDSVLGGVVTENEEIQIDKEELWEKLGLKKDVKELKFSKQFSEGDFLNTLYRKRLYTLLKFIDDNGFYIHVAQINEFYYSLVDIVDSVMDEDELNDYAYR